MTPDTFTTEDIAKAIAQLEDANVPPLPCTACHRTYYLMVTTPGADPSSPIFWVCDCGAENYTSGVPCAGALVGDAVRYQGRARTPR